jgi:protein TonB
MDGLQKKPRWFIAVIIALHSLAFYLLLGQALTYRIGYGNTGALNVTSFDIQPPAPSAHAAPTPRMLFPSALQASQIELPGIDLGPATRHDQVAPRTGARAQMGGGSTPQPAVAAAGAAPVAPVSGEGDGISELPAGLVRYLVQPRGTYPPGAANANEAGTAKVRIEFDEGGRPVRAELLSSTGFARLDEAAIDAAMLAILAPLPGPKRRVYVTQDIVFMVH